MHHPIQMKPADSEKSNGKWLAARFIRKCHYLWTCWRKECGLSFLCLMALLMGPSKQLTGLGQTLTFGELHLSCTHRWKKKRFQEMYFFFPGKNGMPWPCRTNWCRLSLQTPLIIKMKLMHWRWITIHCEVIAQWLPNPGPQTGSGVKKIPFLCSVKLSAPCQRLLPFKPIFSQAHARQLLQLMHKACWANGQRKLLPGASLWEDWLER